MIEKAIDAIKNSSRSTRIIVGCDSIRFKKKMNGKKVWYAKYCTAIAVHKDGNKGGRMFWETETVPDYGSIRQRMMNEVMYTVNLALQIHEYASDRLDIHLDINPDPKHKSNVAYKEAIGYVKGTLGITPVCKPDSWCATHCADYLVKKGR